jgi:protoporphyrinogen oxidase
MKQILVLGAGISGISAAYHLSDSKYTVSIFESNKSYGGLLDNFSPKKGFIFDKFIHLSFTQNEYVKEIFDKSSESFVHNPVSYNLSEGIWLKHPVQFNLFPLPTEEKIKIIKGFLKIDKNKEPQNYQEWLYQQYGKYFSDNYPIKYTRKYWATEADKLTTDWVSSRFNIPDIDQVLGGALETQSENHYYAKSMRYPKEGGYKSYLKHMVSKIDINCNKKAVSIDLNKKNVFFKDGSYAFFDKLVSTIPLPELIKIINNVPEEVSIAASKLIATSGQLVSFGFNKVIPEHLWFYIYDEDFLPARAYSPSMKSKNNAPDNMSSIQFETYFSIKNKPKLVGQNLIDHIINKASELGIFEKKDIEVIDYREVKYANVVFNFDREKNLKIVHKYLDSKNIEYCGRFGMWDYLWSDQCLISGKETAEKIINKNNI